MTKQLLFDDQARSKIISGAQTVAKAVGSTLGPKGSNVAYDRPFGAPHIVHDGVTVAKQVELEDKFEKIAADSLIDAAEKTNNEAGDGTTTAIVLANALVVEGNKLVAAGYNPMELRRDIEKAVDKAYNYLSDIAKPVKTDGEILQVATISAQNEFLGQIIAAAFKKLGKEAVIAVEESSTNSTTVEYKDGMEIDRGFLSPYFMTDKEKEEAIVSDANIIITDRTIGDVQELAALFKILEQQKTVNNIVILAGDVTGAALATLVFNKIQAGLNVLAIKAPSFGDKQREMLEDIAAVTGGAFISQDSGRTLESITKADLGRAHKVVSTKDSTTFIDGRGKLSAIEERINTIKGQLKRSTSEFNSEQLEERLAKLSSGIAIINVGGNSEAEIKEVKERVVDAINATKAALDEGIVAGGETALLRASYMLEGSEELFNIPGYRLVKEALKQPFKTLMSNSGYDAGQKLEQLSHKITKDSNFGIDVIDGKVGDLVKLGIIDPVKVSRRALKNAASVAALLITSNTLIVDKPNAGNANPQG